MEEKTSAKSNSIKRECFTDEELLKIFNPATGKRNRLVLNAKRLKLKERQVWYKLKQKGQTLPSHKES